MSAVLVRRRIDVRGVVQGVGFRPHVARLASDLGLAGDCRNDATRVVIDIEGDLARVDEFRRLLVDQAPPMARIDDLQVIDAQPVGRRGFSITESTASAGARTLVPPDTAVCDDCLRELRDPTDRRYRHPFITCTNCGPRLSIITDLPYDRPATTMAGFAMCDACTAEYADPTDRRYHAQPIACRDCGPRLRFHGAGDGREMWSDDALDAAVQLLREGRILAVKGIGGYHLACDARSDDAVRRLRARKNRPHKPFAVMVRDLDAARAVAELPVGAADLLTGPDRPIVLLPAVAGALAPSVDPALDEIGLMLAYAPVHHLLLGDLAAAGSAAPALVMTSGNRAGEPLCFDDDSAVQLQAITDAFLSHDRPIAVPVEDSVIAWSAVGQVPIRRSRGRAPLPVPLPGAGRPVIAAGSELKNTIALAADGLAHLSAHVGDLESYAARGTHQVVAEQMIAFRRKEPELVVVDRHPGYASRAWGVETARSRRIPLIEVQHHHAHLVSLAADHGRSDRPLLGLVLDGTGYGDDGEIWGCELLLHDGGTGFTRLGRLGRVRLAGGDDGVRNPVRTAALAMLDAGVALDGSAPGAELTPLERGFLTKVHLSDSAAVATSSAGRLFDVAASVLGIRHRISYQAQAAVEIEACARTWRRKHPDGSPADLSMPVTDGVIDPRPLVRDLSRGAAEDASVGALAYGFHRALARACAEIAADAAARLGHDTVGLTGGTFVNRVLLAETSAELARRGLKALTHRAIPANDGGLALGQVAIGVRHLENERTQEKEQWSECV